MIDLFFLNWHYINSLDFSLNCFQMKFPVKFWLMVSSDTTGSLTWNSSGTAVIINEPRFHQNFLETGVFKTKSMHSFVRQLNLYGFKKSRFQISKHISEYIHEHFLRSRRDLLHKITRSNMKTGRRRTAVRATSVPTKSKKPFRSSVFDALPVFGEAFGSVAERNSGSGFVAKSEHDCLSEMKKLCVLASERCGYGGALLPTLVADEFSSVPSIKTEPVYDEYNVVEAYSFNDMGECELQSFLVSDIELSHMNTIDGIGLSSKTTESESLTFHEMTAMPPASSTECFWEVKQNHDKAMNFAFDAIPSTSYDSVHNPLNLFSSVAPFMHGELYSELAAIPVEMNYPDVESATFDEFLF